MINLTPKNHFALAFWVTFIIAAGLIIGGFFTPPLGAIDGTVLTAVGEIFLWPALAFGAKALDEGKKAVISKGDTTIEIGKKEGHSNE